MAVNFKYDPMFDITKNQTHWLHELSEMVIKQVLKKGKNKTDFYSDLLYIKHWYKSMNNSLSLSVYIKKHISAEEIEKKNLQSSKYNLNIDIDSTMKQTVGTDVHW